MHRGVALGLMIGLLTLPFSGASFTPAAEAQQLSFRVSASETGGKFFGPQIVQIVIDAPGIREPDRSPSSLIVNGVNVPLVHLTDSGWYAFVADRGAFTELADGVNLPGNEVSAGGSKVWALGPDGKSALFPSLPNAFGNDSVGGNPRNPNIDLNGDCTAMISAEDPCVEWPYIVLMSFSENDIVSFRHSGQSVNLPYVSPSFDDVTVTLDRKSYPVNAEIILTIADYMWNINPVEEDRIHFAFNGNTAQVFYEASSVLPPAPITSILTGLGFDNKQRLKVEDLDSIEFANSIGGMPETVLIETIPNSGVFENIKARADMFAKRSNAIIQFEYFGKTSSSESGQSDATVSVGKEEPREGEDEEPEVEEPEVEESEVEGPEAGEEQEAEEQADDTTTTLATATITELFSISELGLADIQGNRIDEGLASGEPVLVETDIRNNLEEEQSFVYIVQVKDSDGFTEMLTWIKGRMNPSGTLDYSISWTPEQTGTYEVEIFVWRSLEDPGLAPSPKKMTVTVEDRVS